MNSRRACLHRLLLSGAGACALPALAQTAKDRAASPRTLTWEDLVPKGWDPMALFKEKPVAMIREGSASERALMKEMRDIWDKAPTRQDLAGERVRLPGYVVPLDVMEGKQKEFLLVPYFGACIHSPPPPANQIVHISLKTPVQLNSMEVVWVTGVLDLDRRDTGMGISGYTLAGEKVESYKSDKR